MKALAIGLGACLLTGLGSNVAVAPAHAESAVVATQCAGVGAEARAETFTSWPGVSGAQRITREHRIGKASMHRTAGVQLLVPAREGLSAASLQRIVGCQIALAAEQSGHQTLAVPGLSAQVDRRGAAYRVRLTAEDVSAAQELVRRLGL